MKPEVLITQNPNSDSPLLDRNFWAKLFETFQPIYDNTEQASLAVAKRVLNQTTDSVSKNKIIVLTSEELITRAIQAFEYVEPFQHTEVGKPLFSFVFSILTGSDDASQYTCWSLKVINQFAEYYKDSKYQDYKFEFVPPSADSVPCVYLIDVSNATAPQLLKSYDFPETPASAMTMIVQGEFIYLTDGYSLKRYDESDLSATSVLGKIEEVLRLSNISANLEEVPSGMGISALGTVAALAVGAAFLAKKCGLFRPTATPVVAPGNQPQNNIGPAPRT
jgi:hypothetical protein